MSKLRSQALHIKLSNIEKLVGVATLFHSRPPENCRFRSKNEIFYTFLHNTMLEDLVNRSDHIHPDNHSYFQNRGKTSF